MRNDFRMGLKPINHLHFKNPFTEVNGNSKSVNILPSASADGLVNINNMDLSHI